MPTQREDARSTESESNRSDSVNERQVELKELMVQVDDPIIIKGGSIALSFDQHNFEDITPSTSDKNRKFNHAFKPRLRMLKIFSGGKITPIVLKPGDAIKICYEGSECDDTPP